MTAIRIFLLGVILAAPAGLFPAGSEILYLSHENALWIRDFSPDRPATMDDVLEADRRERWGKVSHDPASDTYSVDASLWIGEVASWEPTYVQIGRPGHPKETVVVKGNVWVRPPMRSPERTDGTSGLVNRLTLGDPENREISATLKIACDSPRQYGFFVGYRPSDRAIVFGADLFVYNSTITAAIPDRDHVLRGAERFHDLHTGCYCNRVRLVGAKVAWVGGAAFYGINVSNGEVTGCTFENCGSLFQQGVHKIADTTFRNTDIPVEGYRMEFIRCKFEGNRENWQLNSLRGYCVETIDCDVQPPLSPFRLQKNSREPKSLLLEGFLVYPVYVDRQTLVVRVVDERGQAVPGAVVEVRADQDRLLETAPLPSPGWRGTASPENIAAARNPTAVTDREGATPQSPEKGAILPALRRVQATEDPLKPAEEHFRYSVQVDAAGYGSVTRELTGKEMETGRCTIIVRRAI